MTLLYLLFAIYLLLLFTVLVGSIIEKVDAWRHGYIALER